ncbi:TPA: methyl-accepting chemotaxis protein, partial [Campylobacter lari]|nr:methyl-accepting chemotaxis protein [Campylobacter lari]
MFKSLNIGLKLVLSVAISIIAGIAILVTILSIQVASNMENEAKNSIFLSAKRYGNFMQGILNEEVVLTKGMATSLNEMFSKYDQVDVALIESLLKNTFDSSGYAAYSFLWLKDPSVLSDTQALDSNFKSSNGKTFAMIFFDETTGKAGGIRSIKVPNNFSQLNILQKIEQNAKYGDLDTLFVGAPSKLNYDGHDFLGINLGMPIFNSKGKFVGVVGYTFDFLEISQEMLDPKLDAYEGDLRFLMTDQGVITIHKNKDAILKTLPEINKDPSTKFIIDAVKERKDIIIDNYTDSNGNLSFASITPFSTLGDSSHWSIIVTAPKKSVLQPLYKLQFILIIIALVIVVIILAIVYFCVNKIVGARIPIILHSLQNFFKFLNHETKEVQTIKIKADDELGRMGKIINENITKTKNALEQDA